MGNEYTFSDEDTDLSEVALRNGEENNIERIWDGMFRMTMKWFFMT